MKVTIIGGGNMGQALASGLLKDGQFEISISDPNIEKLNELAEQGVITHTDNLEAINGATIVILAVKPQQAKEVLVNLSGHLSDVLLVSVAAGIRTSQLKNWSSSNKVVRTMPNTPGFIGKGISAFYSEDIDLENHNNVKKILSVLGEYFEVQDERLMDSVTAISGSGPGYVFYFMEAMYEAAKELGFDDDEARTLSIATFRGASELAASSKESFSSLREKVTSKGGTTEAALNVMNESDLQQIFIDAIKAAKKRGEELSQSMND